MVNPHDHHWIINWLTARTLLFALAPGAITGREEEGAQRQTSQPLRQPSPPELPDLLDVIDEILDQGQEEERRDFERLQPQLQEQLNPIAEALLSFWWHIGDGIAEGWLHVADPVHLHTDNIRGISEDPEFRAELEGAGGRRSHLPGGP